MLRFILPFIPSQLEMSQPGIDSTVQSIGWKTVQIHGYDYIIKSLGFSGM